MPRWTQFIFYKELYFQSLFLWPFLPDLPTNINPFEFYECVCVFCFVIFWATIQVSLKGKKQDRTCRVYILWSLEGKIEILPT